MNDELKALAQKTIARIRLEYLTRCEKARRIRVIRRTVRWGHAERKNDATR